MAARIALTPGRAQTHNIKQLRSTLMSGASDLVRFVTNEKSKSRSIVKDSTGEGIKAIQNALNAHRRYWGLADSCTPNGTFDDATEAALKAFQQHKKNLTQFTSLGVLNHKPGQDGQIDVITVLVLDNWMCEIEAHQSGNAAAGKAPPVTDATTLSEGDDDPRVKDLQQCLIELLYASEADLSGETQFGPRTKLALKEFQWDWELDWTGIYNPKTKDAMEKALSSVHGPGMPAENGGQPQSIHYAGRGSVGSYTDKTNDIKFDEPDKPALADAWENVRAGPHEHGFAQLCADINSRCKDTYGGQIEHGNEGDTVDVYGPGTRFKVARRFVAKGLGGMVCAVIPERNVRVFFGHITDISQKVYQAAKTQELLDPGTFLGRTTRPIGAQSGLHLHIQAYALDYTAMVRKEWFPKLRRVDEPRDTDDPQIELDPVHLFRMQLALSQLRKGGQPYLTKAVYTDETNDAVEAFRKDNKINASPCDGKTIDPETYSKIVNGM